MLSCVRPGLVDKVPFKEGDMVKADQVIIQLDDSVEASETERLKYEAEDKTRIEAAEAELQQAKVDLKRMEEANARGAATDLELQHAELAVLIKDLTLKLAFFNQKQAQRQFEQAQLVVERMKIRSPIDGRIERIVVKEGEATETSEKIVRVVRIDPLWIDVPAPLSMVRERLKEGQAAVVVFENADGTKVEAEGKIDRISTVADSASETLNVRVEVPNPSQRPAGEHVTVRFPAAEEAGGQTKVEP